MTAKKFPAGMMSSLFDFAAQAAEVTRPTAPAPVEVPAVEIAPAPVPVVASAPPAPPAPPAANDPPPAAEEPDLLPDYIAHLRVRTLSEKHIEHVRQQLADCQRTLAKRLVATSKADHKRYDAILAERQAKGKMKASTRRKYQASIRGFFAWAVDEEHLTVDPARKAYQSPKLPKRLPKFLTEAELAQLLDGAGRGAYPERDRALIATMAYCGLRIAEALGLDWERIADGYLTVIGKNDKERRCPIPDVLWPYLEAWRALHPHGGTGAVFTGARAPHYRLGYDTVWRKYFPKLVKLAGIKRRVTSHCLRHTFATHLLQSGQVPLDQIQVLLGHENISTTQTYAKTRIDGSTVAGINAALGRPAGET